MPGPRSRAGSFGPGPVKNPSPKPLGRRLERRPQIMGGPVVPNPGGVAAGAARIVGDVLRPRPMVPQTGEAGRLATAAVWPQRIINSVVSSAGPKSRQMGATRVPKPVDTSAKSITYQAPSYQNYRHPAAKVGQPKTTAKAGKTTKGSGRSGGAKVI